MRVLAALLLLCAPVRAGVVLESVGTGLEGVQTAVPAGKAIPALVLDGKSAYFPPIPMSETAAMARALAKDPRLGVSLGAAEINYGKMPGGARMYVALKLADRFLGDIVFARDDWNRGYRHAGGYVPRKETKPGDLAMFISLNTVSFEIQGEAVRTTGIRATVQLIPLAKEKTKDGGNLPDYKAIEAGVTYPNYVANAEHVGANIAYYGQERVVGMALKYAETAAFLRGLKAAGVDLNALATDVEKHWGKAPPATSRELERAWTEYLKDIQAKGDYPNWPGPPHDLYVRGKGR